MDVAEVLREYWDLKPTEVEVLTGGMNSTVWLASTADWKVVVKAVGLDDTGFEPGLALAARLADTGISTGRPHLSRHARYVERVGNHQLAVLDYIDGEELGSMDQESIGGLLARVHAAAPLEPGSTADWLRFLLPFEESLDLEPWIRPAVEGAVADAIALGPVSWAWLHGDPAAEAFRRQPDGRIALIDWGGAMRGPILYDIASAVMYVGRPVVPAYLQRRPELAEELRAGLEAFLHVCYAVQAGYFAWRITTNLLTGITGPQDNRNGLNDARRSFGL